MRKKPFILLLVAAVIIAVFVSHQQDDQPKSTPKSSSQQSHKPSNTPGDKPTNQQPAFDKSEFSTTDPASLWVIVNKSHPLGATYTPNDLVLPAVTQRVPGTTEMKMRKAAAAALKTMFAGAKSNGYNLVVSTAYRGYSYQSVLYTNDKKAHGQTAADKATARPGYSEHQSGWAVDIRSTTGTCSIQQCFGNTPEGKWLATNSYKYGFILRYTEDKEGITGYEYEPWHFRYVGAELANEMHKQGIETLEEFFGVSGGTYR